jgi:hypothetical protein
MSILKPPVAVRPGALLRARQGQVLAPRAEHDLFRVAEVLSEGRSEGSAYFGSTLVTFDLRRLDPRLLSAASMLSAIEGSVRVRLRIARLALEDVARRHPDALLGTATLESRFRADGTCILVDVDVEVPFASPLLGPSAARGAS